MLEDLKIPESGEGLKPADLPDLDRFQVMPVKDKIQAFVGLPVHAQKVLISLCAYTTSVSPSLLEQIRDPIPVQRRLAERAGKKFDEEKARKGLHWTPEEFDDALEILMQSKYVLKEPDLRSKIDRTVVAEPIKSFVNTDLRKIWKSKNQGTVDSKDF